jgi:putative ABC transport system ATP-binding protein
MKSFRTAVMTFIVQTVDLSKEVESPEGPLTILEEINLTIEEGEALAVLGASGSGKSTLLGLLAGLDLPSAGRVILDGVDLASLDEDGRAALRARTLGFVFQSFQLLPSLTAVENVMLPLELSGAESPRERAEGLLERVGLGPRQNHYSHQLSGGEQQRVAIARAFATEPRLLLADEPTGNLDTRTGAHIIDLLFALNEERNTTLVLVTHDSELASRCHRHVVLDAGRIIS